MHRGGKSNDDEQRQLQDVTLDAGHRAAAALHQRPAWRQWNEAGK